MYEISPYATFSVNGGRTTSGLSKTPTRGVTTSTLDYTVQFKTFGHPDADNLNATAYPVLPNPSGFGHVKGKSSWHNQRYYNTDGNDANEGDCSLFALLIYGEFLNSADDSTLSKSMTIMAGSSQLQSHRIKGGKRDIDMSRNSRSKSRNEIAQPHHPDTESDTSGGSPVNEFSNMPTYRVPTKSRGGKRIYIVMFPVPIIYSTRYSFSSQKCFVQTRAQNQIMTIHPSIEDQIHRVTFRPR